MRQRLPTRQTAAGAGRGLPLGLVGMFARRLGAVRLEGVRLIAVPAVFGVIALAILVYGQFESLSTPAVVLAAAAMLAVIARMALTFRDKLQLLAAARIEAETDALTGIGNRRKLMTDLEATLTDGAPAMLMLLDLDGFKAYNDTFGHPAGDALLARLAKKLAASIGASGEVYRIGGDEFCVLAPVETARLQSFAAAAQTALQEHGEGFRITAAQGSVSLPEEAAEVAEALRLVDERMYDEKDGRRAAAGRQSRDVLLRVLYERDARLQGHLTDLVELVRAVGAYLNLPQDELSDLSLAAELHEVGKLAIPDSILRKPGTLTDDEWRFVRRHTLIGERILSSAPALAEGLDDRPLDARANRRTGLSRRARRRGDPPRVAHHRRLRRLLRDDEHRSVPAGAHARRGDRRAPPLRGHALRRPRRRRDRGTARRNRAEARRRRRVTGRPPVRRTGRSPVRVPRTGEPIRRGRAKRRRP